MASASPRTRIEAACATLGSEEVIARCVAILRGEEAEPDFLMVIGGLPARRLLGEGLPQGQMYWLRVWALRGLLWASPGHRVQSICDSLEDDHWRVREMACKVVARHGVDDALDGVERLRSDKVVRVRRTAERAVRRIVESAG